MSTRAALGFRLHTGWASLVAVAGELDRLEPALRRRIELLPPGDAVPRFVYHEAAGLSAPEAPAFIQRAEAAAQQTASAAISAALTYLGSQGFSLTTAGIACGSKPLPKDLAAILRSHPMIHTAEGILFQLALASACQSCGLAVIPAREREVWRSAAAAWNVQEAALRARVDGLRKSAGAPWGADQKTAAAFALLALQHRA